MANFNGKTNQIELTEEEKETFKMCQAALNNPRITFIPNLTQALRDNFIGWEVRKKEKSLVEKLVEELEELKNLALMNPQSGDIGGKFDEIINKLK